MDNIGTNDKKIRDNIEAIILKDFSTNKESVNTDKIIAFLKNKYGLDADENLVSDILSNIPFISDITNTTASLNTQKKSDKDETDEEIHDTAVGQIDDHMKFESVADALTAYKVGDIIKSSKIKLNESDEHYHLYYGSKKANRNYIVCEIMPKKKINESYFRCKIEGTALYINIPVRSLM
jgi:hypothetical protein